MFILQQTDFKLYCISSATDHEALWSIYSSLISNDEIASDLNPSALMQIVEARDAGKNLYKAGKYAEAEQRFSSAIKLAMSTKVEKQEEVRSWALHNSLFII